MTESVRLRMNRTALLPVLVFTLCLLPVAFVSPWALTVLAAPVLLAVWIRRTGVAVGEHGITVESVAGSRHVPWPEIVGIRVGTRGELSLVTTRDTEIRLPVLRARDLPQLSEVSGGRIAVPAPPAI